MMSFGHERFNLISAGFVKVKDSIYETWLHADSGFTVRRQGWMSAEAWEQEMARGLKQFESSLDY